MVNITKTVAGALAGLIIGNGLMASNAMAGGNVRLDAGNASSVLTTKYWGNTPLKDLNFFGKFKMTETYPSGTNPNKTSFFSFLDMTYPIGSGLSLVAEGQFSDTIVPSFGFAYSNKLNDNFSIFTQTTYSLNKSIDASVSLGYSTKLLDGIDYFATLDSINNVAFDGSVFGSEMLSAGVKSNGYSAGLAINAIEASKPGFEMTPLNFGYSAFISADF